MCGLISATPSVKNPPQNICVNFVNWTFWLFFTFLVCPKAATLFTASNGKFSSPGYPSDVPPGLDEANKRACTWNITVAAGKRVKLNFTHLNFGTCSSQCDQCTHLDIYDGDSKSSPSLGRFCPGSAKEVKVSSGNQMFVEFESGFGNDRGTGFEVQYSETDDPPTDVGDASTTVTTKPTDEQTNKPSDKPTDKPSDKPTVKQAEPPTSNYYFILIFMLCLMVQIRPSLQVHNHALDIYIYIYLFSKMLQFENLY